MQDYVPRACVCVCLCAHVCVFVCACVRSTSLYPFQAGDDLRQDMIVMQMIRLFDDMWKKAGLDLKIITYGVVATGQDTGELRGSALVQYVLYMCFCSAHRVGLKLPAFFPHYRLDFLPHILPLCMYLNLSLYLLFPTSQAPSHFHPPPLTHLPPTSSHLLPPSPSCLTSSGMLEFVEGCETLREIQTTQGVTGSFKDHVLADWLMRHNPTKTAYKQVNSVGF